MATRTCRIGTALTLLAVLAFLPNGGLPNGPCEMCIQRTGSPQGGEVPEGLTRQEWSGIRAAIERDRYRLRPCELEGKEVYQAPNDAQGLQATFTPDGVEMSPPAGGGEWRWGLRLLCYGYGELCEAVSPAQLVVLDNRIEYRRGELVEWYVNGRGGLEQGFTVSRPPGGSDGDAPLQLHLGVTGDLTPVLDSDGQAIGWADRDGVVVLTYAGLYAVDTTGRELPAEMLLGEEGIVLAVEEKGASYPVTIDPMIQRAKFTASDAAADDRFGFSVAVSGNTVIIGAPTDAAIGEFFTGVPSSSTDSGAAYVFEKPIGGWLDSTEVAKLTASDAGGRQNFGFSVAIGGDTVIVGADYSDGGPGLADSGAAYVFEKPIGGWSGTLIEDARLTASDADAFDHFGSSVAISGGTVAVGAAEADARCGAAYVFEKPIGGWSGTLVEDAKLTASGATELDWFGKSIAISGDTVVVGAWGDSNFYGAAYVFEKPIGGWSGALNEDAKLTATDGKASYFFGSSVAISGDTVIVGADYSDGGPGLAASGAAYVFEKPIGGWSGALVEDAKLAASDADPFDYFGGSVAISGDTVVVGAWGKSDFRYGAAYVFDKPIGGWSGTLIENAKLTANDAAAEDWFGYSIAFSGNTVVIGAVRADCADGADCGTAYLFDPFRRYDPGDVSGDGEIDLLDVVLCQQIARGWLAGTARQRAAADVDGDGDVDEDDVTILSEYVLGIRVTLP
jgi:hypothetical protein